MAWLTDTGLGGPTAVSHKHLASAQIDHCRDQFWRSFQLFCTFTFLIHLDWQVQVGSAAGLAGCWCQWPRQITFIITSCHITFIHFALDQNHHYFAEGRFHHYFAPDDNHHHLAVDRIHHYFAPAVVCVQTQLLTLVLIICHATTRSRVPKII